MRSGAGDRSKLTVSLFMMCRQRRDFKRNGWRDRMCFSSLWRPENGKVLRQTFFFKETWNVGRHAMGMKHDIGVDMEGKGKGKFF